MGEDNFSGLIRSSKSHSVSVSEHTGNAKTVRNRVTSDEQKIELFQESFKKLSSYTIEAISKSIQKIDTNQGSTDDPVFISEFINNTDKEIFNAVQKHIENLNEQNKIKPLQVAVTDEMREQGVTNDILEVPLTFDPSTFFV